MERVFVLRGTRLVATDTLGLQAFLAQGVEGLSDKYPKKCRLVIFATCTMRPNPEVKLGVLDLATGNLEYVVCEEVGRTFTPIKLEAIDFYAEHGGQLFVTLRWLFLDANDRLLMEWEYYREHKPPKATLWSRVWGRVLGV